MKHKEEIEKAAKKFLQEKGWNLESDDSKRVISILNQFTLSLQPQVTEPTEEEILNVIRGRERFGWSVTEVSKQQKLAKELKQLFSQRGSGGVNGKEVFDELRAKGHYELATPACKDYFIDGFEKGKLFFSRSHRKEVEELKKEISEIKRLFDLLAMHGGKIVSTASLDVEDINQAREGQRMLVDENSLGYAWIPKFDKMPETVEEVKNFEKWYPLDVELPEKLKTVDWIFEKNEANLSSQSGGAISREKVQSLYKEVKEVCRAIKMHHGLDSHQDLFLPLLNVAEELKELSQLSSNNKSDAVEFAKWICNNEGEHQLTLVDNNWYFESDKEGDQFLSEEELYEIFKSQNNK